MRRALLLILVAAAARAQPVAPSLERAQFVLLDVADVGPALHPTDDGWEAPPVLYWTGVAVDGVLLGSGTYVAVVMADLLLTDLDEAGLAAPAVLTVGSVLFLTGASAATFAGIDLIRVFQGGDPFLARLLDPTRPREGRPPRYPFPPRPPH